MNQFWGYFNLKVSDGIDIKFRQSSDYTGTQIDGNHEDNMVFCADGYSTAKDHFILGVTVNSSTHTSNKNIEDNTSLFEVKF